MAFFDGIWFIFLRAIAIFPLLELLFLKSSVPRSHDTDLEDEGVSNSDIFDDSDHNKHLIF